MRPSHDYMLYNSPSVIFNFSPSFKRTSRDSSEVAKKGSYQTYKSEILTSRLDLKGKSPFKTIKPLDNWNYKRIFWLLTL
jgi:hypothetical protein